MFKVHTKRIWGVFLLWSDLFSDILWTLSCNLYISPYTNRSSPKIAKFQGTLSFQRNQEQMSKGEILEKKKNMCQVCINNTFSNCWLWRSGGSPMEWWVNLPCIPWHCTRRVDKLKEISQFQRRSICFVTMNSFTPGCYSCYSMSMYLTKASREYFFLRSFIFKWDEWFCGKPNKKLWSCFGVVFCFYFSVTLKYNPL